MFNWEVLVVIACACLFIGVCFGFCFGVGYMIKSRDEYCDYCQYSNVGTLSE